MAGGVAGLAGTVRVTDLYSISQSMAGGAVTLTSSPVFIESLNGDRNADVVLYNPTTGAWAQGLNTAGGAFTYGSGTWATALNVVGARSIP